MLRDGQIQKTSISIDGKYIYKLDKYIYILSYFIINYVDVTFNMLIN